ncbi:unnamed protein product [Jaminaea pallidilutea]
MTRQACLSCMAEADGQYLEASSTVLLVKIRGDSRPLSITTFTGLVAAMLSFGVLFTRLSNLTALGLSQGLPSVMNRGARSRSPRRIGAIRSSHYTMSPCRTSMTCFCLKRRWSL